LVVQAVLQTTPEHLPMLVVVAFTQEDFVVLITQALEVEVLPLRVRAALLILMAATAGQVCLVEVGLGLYLRGLLLVLGQPTEEVHQNRYWTL
jgi:hypothetical protein